MPRSSKWADFWRAYEDRGQNERPSVFRRQDYPGLGVNNGAIFSATIRMCDEFRNLPRSQRIVFSKFRFYIDGQRIDDPVEYLMLGSDGDFVGWHNRMSGITENYCIVFNRLESKFGEDIECIQELLQPFVEQAGLPMRRSEITLFAGRYRKTPFGIHTDDELNFFWPVIGPKRMRFWSPEYGAANPALARALNYGEHMAESLLIDAEAGDMIAWPGRWWHIAEGGDEFSVSLTIPLEWYPLQQSVDQAQIVHRLSKLLLRVTAGQSKSTLIPIRSQEDTSEAIPQAIAEAAQLFAKIRPDEIADYLTEHWLRRMTTAGLEISKPQQNDFDISDGQLIRVVSPGTIRWTRLSRGRICVGSCGHSVVFPPSESIVEILRILKTCRTVSLRSLADHVAAECNDASALPITKFVLTMLAKMGALEAGPSELSQSA